MKSRISYILLSLLLIFSFGCTDEWLDINDDPDNPAEANIELVFPAGALEIASVVGGYYNLVGGFWSQFWTQANASNQYKEYDAYSLLSTDFDDQWGVIYAGGLSDLRYVKTTAADEENWSFNLMATVMEAYTFQIMTDIYGDIPYFEALKGGTEKNFTPAFDDGATIYTDLIIQLDDALSKDFSATSATLSESEMAQDQIFNGDIELWKQFANTLKLKIYLRQMYARPDVAEAGIKELYNAGAQFLSSDAKLDIFIDGANKDNPLYASDRRGLNTKLNLRSSATLNNYLKHNSDPRLAHLVDLAPDGTDGIPMPQGGFNLTSQVLEPTSVAVVKLSPTTPVYFITATESYLLQAEAVAKGWGTGDAKSLYDMGVSAAFAMYGEDGTSFIADGGVYKFPSGSDFEAQQKAIIMQKWVSMANIQGIEAFIENSRTHYPPEFTDDSNGPWVNNAYNADFPGGAFTYSMAATTGGLYPKRLLIPQKERAANSSITEEILSAKVTNKIWWDKK